jgi:hypothetical protein
LNRLMKDVEVSKGTEVSLEKGDRKYLEWGVGGERVRWSHSSTFIGPIEEATWEEDDEDEDEDDEDEEEEDSEGNFPFIFDW